MMGQDTNSNETLIRYPRDIVQKFDDLDGELQSPIQGRLKDDRVQEPSWTKGKKAGTIRVKNPGVRVFEITFSDEQYDKLFRFDEKVSNGRGGYWRKRSIEMQIGKQMLVQDFNEEALLTKDPVRVDYKQKLSQTKGGNSYLRVDIDKVGTLRFFVHQKQLRHMHIDFKGMKTQSLRFLKAGELEWRLGKLGFFNKLFGK